VTKNLRVPSPGMPSVSLQVLVKAAHSGFRCGVAP
jgi:hypothetical protein